MILLAFLTLNFLVAKENSTKPQIQYNFTPSTEFCSTMKQDSDKAISPKTERKSTSSAATRSNPEIESATASSPNSKSQHKGLNAVLEHIMPSEMHTRFKNDPELCVASWVTKPNVRCTNKIKRQPVGGHTVLDAVSGCIQKGDFATLPEDLEKLAKILLCGRHQKVALKQPKAKARINALRDFILDLPQASEEDTSTFRAWTMALASLSPPSPTRRSARELSPFEIPLEKNITMALNTKTTSHLPGFLPYKSSRVSDVDIVKNLKKLIAKPLTPTDLKSGFIYIFWDQGTFGMVKIGRTSDLKRRLKEWNRCKSTHSYHKASQNRELVTVPHVQRIERLIQTELVNTRKKRPCDSCEKTKVHQEWFEITEAKAVEVFQKWRTWILNTPYIVDDEGKWVIRPEMLETIPGLCKLEPEEVQVAKARTRPGNNRSKRPKPRRSFATQTPDASESIRTSRNVPRS